MRRTTEPQPYHTSHAQTRHADLHGLVWAMDVFAELVGAAGPLCHLRFDAKAFARCTADLAQGQEGLSDAAEEAIEEAFAEHAEHLCTQAITAHMQQVLVDFAALPYIDVSHRLAAQTAAALMTSTAGDAAAQSSQAPTLYVIFRAQAMQTHHLDGDRLQPS